MKNFTFIMQVILTLAVAVLFYFHFSQKSAPLTGIQPTIPVDSTSILVSDTNLRVTAYINTDTLFEKYNYVKDMRDELAAEKLKSESSYNAALKKLEKEVYEFQEKAPYMTQQEGESKQLDLAEKEQKLMKLERELSVKYADLEMEKNKLIQKAVSEYLERINREKNYAYIFGYNGLGNVLLAHPGLDITDMVISGLNREHEEKTRKK